MHLGGSLPVTIREGLYERAAAETAELGPLWHVDDGRTFFVGPLEYNALHQHGAPVYLAGIYGLFGLRMQGGEWLLLPHRRDPRWRAA